MLHIVLCEALCVCRSEFSYSQLCVFALCSFTMFQLLQFDSDMPTPASCSATTQQTDEEQWENTDLEHFMVLKTLSFSPRGLGMS